MSIFDTKFKTQQQKKKYKNKNFTQFSCHFISFPFIDPSKSSQCSSLSDGESFECFGENDHMTSNIDNSTGTIVVDTGVDIDQAPQIHK